MLDFRLKVFLTVAQRMSFTKAAAELFISQPAVSKHIKEIEKNYHRSLFERKGNVLKLTASGEILKEYALKIMALHQEMDIEINFQNEKHHGILEIGASTTASQYVLPRFIAYFRKNFPKIYINLKTDNTEKIEALLLNNETDVAVVEGKSKRSSLHYLPFQKDEIVLCTHIDTPVPPVLKTIHKLKSLPVILREKGSGTLEIISNALNKNKIKTNELSVEIILENNESIKSYLQNSRAFAFLSISAIQNELANNKLKIIEIEGFSIERYYYIVTKTENQNPLVNLFAKILIDNKWL